MTKPKAKTLIPARPDLDALRKRRRCRGKEILIGGRIERILFKSDLRRLGKKAIAGARTISMGEIEITVEERNRLLAWIEHLESHIDKKYLAPKPLNAQERRMVEIDVQAWAESKLSRKDRRSKKSVYQPWAAVQEFFPKNFTIEERTLNRLRDRENYKSEFIAGCAAQLMPASSKRHQK